MWPRLLLSARDGVPPADRSHMVVWPESAREVCAIVRAAPASAACPIVPYGGGSRRVRRRGAVHGGITVDLKRMDRSVGVHSRGLVVRRRGRPERRALRARSQSPRLHVRPLSVVDLLLDRRRLAGHPRRRPDVDQVRQNRRHASPALTVVTGRGELIETDGLARASSRPNWTQLLVGSEGTLGIITSARLRVRPAPRVASCAASSSTSVAAGVEAMRRVMQRGLAPRRHPPLRRVRHLRARARRHGRRARHAARPPPPRARPEPGTGALPALPGPDEPRESRCRGSSARLTARDGAGRSWPCGAGCDVGRTVPAAPPQRAGVHGGRARVAPGLPADRRRRGRAHPHRGRGQPRVRRARARRRRATWAKSRAAPGSRTATRSRTTCRKSFYATARSSTRWRSRRPGSACSTCTTRFAPPSASHAVVMAHFSHAYPEGCSIYFIVRGPRAETAPRRRAPLRRDLARRARGRPRASGGTISHHHGVGLLKAAAWPASTARRCAVLRGLKRTFDPDGVMNPGKLGLVAGDDA